MYTELKDRRLFQVAIGYLAGGWLFLEAAWGVGAEFGWPDSYRLVVFTLVAAGFPAALVLGWFHGEKGRQEVSRLELTLLVMIGVAGLGSATVVGYTTASEVDIVLARDPAPLDSTRYVVLPFRGSGSMSEEFSPELLLHDAFRRWRGLDIVEQFTARDRASADSTIAPTLERARALATSLSAGRFVTGEVTRIGDGSARVYAAIFDTRTGEPVADTAIAWTGAGAPGPEVYRRVADALLFRGAGEAVEDAGEPGTTSFEGYVAFLRGQSAISDWDLPRAAIHFEEATRHDPGYARAHLWRAQVANWSGEAGSDVLALAERANTGRESLTARELLLLSGLLSLERGRFADACAAYYQLRERSQDDFAAWYGLGACHRRDPVVVRDPASPTGWRFRSSNHQAVIAYRRAFELLPALHRGFATRTYEDVRWLLFTVTDQVRPGAAAPPDTGRFAAWPALQGDTLALVPHPLSEFSRGEAGVRPATHWAAMEHQREVLLDLARAWAGTFPDSPEALEALALSMDLIGDPAALDTLRRARQTAPDRETALRLALEEIRLLVKFETPSGLEALRRARHLADSVLAEPGLETGSAGDLAVAAALTGRVFRAAQLARTSAEPRSFPAPLPVAVTRLEATLLAFAAFGVPTDSIADYEVLLESALRNRVAPEELEAARNSAMDRAATLAVTGVPLTRTEQLARSSGYPLLRAQAALLAGDPERARAERLGMRTGLGRPADRAPDHYFPDAWLAIELGDTAAAIAALDSTLSAIRWLGPGGLDEVADAATLVRAMALRADLAMAAGDRAAAARWARPVVVLWADADPPLHSILERMKIFAELSHPVPSPQEVSSCIPQCPTEAGGLPPSQPRSWRWPPHVTGRAKLADPSRSRHKPRPSTR